MDMQKQSAPARCAWALALTLALALLGAACRPKQTGLPTLTPTTQLQAATPTPTAALPSPTPTAVVVYVVKAGDSLSAIALSFGVPTEALAEANGIDDPNLIRAGQELIIPGPTPLPTATVLPTATPTPHIPPQLEIVDVIGRGAPTAETVVIVNRGRGLSLHNWSLRDAHGNAFVFPNLYLASGAELRVHTGVGESTPQHLYWGRESAVWEEAGDMVVLADERGVMYAALPLE
jgi:LysM repeat protein